MLLCIMNAHCICYRYVPLKELCPKHTCVRVNVWFRTNKYKIIKKTNTADRARIQFTTERGTVTKYTKKHKRDESICLVSQRERERNHTRERARRKQTA